MTRNLSTLGAALAAILAMCTTTWAAIAEGAEFHSDGAPTALVGLGETNLSFDGGKITCKGAEYSGEQTGTTSSTLKLIPGKMSCTGFGNANVTIHWNGCYLVHQISVDVGPPLRYTARVELFCPTTEGGVKDEVVITAVEFGVPKCTIQIPAQVVESGGTYTNGEVEGAKDITIDYSIATLQYSQKAGEGLGKCANALGTKNGGYTGEVTVSGRNSKSEPTSIWVE
jgi:hypothetical protein